MPKLKPPRDVTPNKFKNVTNTVPEEYVDFLSNYLERNKIKYLVAMNKIFKASKVTNSLSINRVRNRYYKHKEVINLRVSKKDTTLTKFISGCLPIANEAIERITKRYDPKTVRMVNIDTEVGRDDYVMKVKIICETFGEMVFPEEE